jgi:hypothetical protein
MRIKRAVIIPVILALSAAGSVLAGSAVPAAAAAAAHAPCAHRPPIGHFYYEG